MLWMGAQKTPLQKTYEISKGTDSLNVEFLGSNKKFDWIEDRNINSRWQER